MSQSPGGRHSPCFGVIERSTGRRFLAQRKPLDDELERDIQMHNVLRASPDLAQLHQVIEDNGEAILVYENADRSFLDSLLPPPSARRSLSRSPSAVAATGCANAESPRPITREEQVQVFVKQLLTALQYMHRRGIAHLDLRPEVILLQDDHLRLADFGQSRRLINGKVMGGTIKSNPEFVSPEVIAGGTVTLAADMWSVGALTHVLLVGQSPFLGDNDEETLQNVLKGEFKLEGPNSGQISDQAKDFVRRLLISEPFHRLNAEQALGHDWLSDPSLGEAKLSTDCLREFKYNHKWLERRVFVQQTPSDQLTQLVETPRANLCTASSQEGQTKADARPARAEPFAVYDYLRIKEESRPEGARRDFPQAMRDSVGRNLSAPPERVPPQRPSPGPHSHSQSPHRQPSPHGQQPRYPLEAPPVPDWIVAQLPPGVKKEQLCWDPYGGGFYLPQQFQPGGGKQGGHQQAPPLPPRSRSGGSPAERNQSPGGGAQMPSTVGAPSQLAPLPAGIAKKIEAMAAAAAAQKEQQQNQQKQAKSNEAENMEELARQLGVNDLKLEDLRNPQSTLMKLIRGERRQIQDELANRVLSDISEESSLIDSTTQNSDRSTTRQQLPNKSAAGGEEDASTTTTAEHEGPSSSTVTPLASPTSTGEQFFPEQEPPPPEVLEESEQQFSSRNLPLHIPPYLDTHPKGGNSIETPEQQILAARGVKSPVQRSPSGEHIMSVQIGVGKKEKEEEGKEGQKMGQMEGKKEDLAKQKEGDEMGGNNKFRSPPDTEFDLLMDAVDRVKQDQQRRINEKQRPNIPVPEKDDLERYRPYSIYKEFELDVKRQQMPKDDFAWESNYQIGPETLLVPTIGARFNARVRDYRRGIWGDSASYVMGGELGERNGDVTVRERRRYTDLIREEPLIQKSVDNVLEGLLQTHEGALRRIGGEEEGNGQPAANGQMNGQPTENGQTIKNGEKKFAPIFRSRLRDGFFTEGAASVVFECQAIGNPQPEVTFFHHESAICEDGRHQIVRNGNNWRLTVLKPLAGADTGEYSCIAENELGRDKCVCKCRGGEAPTRPTRPEVELSADTEVYISWEPPERVPVTLEGIHYRLECRPAGEKDAFAAWTIVSNCVEDEAAIVKHLMPMGIYQFRVTARNEFGWGEPSIHSRIIRTHPRGIPKLNLDVLRKEGRRFAIVTMPQKSGRKGNGLSEIREGLAEREEEEEEEEEREENAENGGEQKGEDGTNGTNGNGTKKVPLNTTEDPLKRFQLESELFRGQFSVIRYAIDSKSGAHCTVKIRAAPSHGSLMFATPAERMKAALVEYETLAECQHENIVQLIAAYCSDNSFQLLFTERLHENLFQRFVRLDSYTEEQIAFVARQIAAALKWMHFNGVVHGDVEPTNLMFTTKRSWCVKLVDFGRARRIGSREGLAGDGQLLAEWTAPEILVARMSRNGGGGSGQPSPNGGNVQLANPQTDMWGLGLVTFCLLAGYHPFSYDDDSETDIRRNVLEQRCDPNLIPVQASEEALKFVVWALKKDPSRRMRPDEALGHRWLAADGAMVRRRENIKYNAQRLIRTAERRLRQQCQFARNGNGGGHSPVGPSNTQNGGGAIGPRNGEGGNGGGFVVGTKMGGGGNGQIGRMDQIGGQKMNDGQRKGPPPQQQRRKIVSAEC